MHQYLQQKAQQQVNTLLTKRNWLVGYYLVEYEQNGEDRATYGKQLLPRLAENLKKNGLKGLDVRGLTNCRRFYQTYPEIWQTVTAELQFIENKGLAIRGTLTPKLGVTREERKTDEQKEYSFTPEILITQLSYSHFIELLKVDIPLKRNFYEVQAIKNNWSVRQLERAVNTLLFERTGLSADKKSIIAKVKDDANPTPQDVVKNPYFLEFLGLEEKPQYSESDLEEAIINQLQNFLIELGRGFCFEARQKRITFDNQHYKIDLVFYNRIIKCHVLLDLKVGSFDHADAGQMNLYLNYYRKNEMTRGDNPPIGIILCANKNDALVEYATQGLPQEIFVSKYMVQLPSVEELKSLIKGDIEKFKK